MTTGWIRAAIVLMTPLVPSAVGCREGGDTTAASASARAAAAPAPSASAAPQPQAKIGEPCGVALGRACTAPLTCVVAADRTAACLLLARGDVCGSFQCKADEACCDPSRSECSPAGAECSPRADAGARGATCRRDSDCEPTLRCDIPTTSPIGICSRL